MMPDTVPPLLRSGLSLATRGVPVVPLSRGKRPVGNCHDCAGLACGGRPHMKTPGPCRCPRPCHGWAAATADPDVLTSRAWAPAWRTAGTLAYHPGGAGLTVVDLDSPEAVTWARGALPATRTVSTSRGEHWIYRGTMPSANAVHPGVDIKSLQSYARWRGPGDTTTPLVPRPDALLQLLPTEEATQRPAVASSSTCWDHTVAAGCRHTSRYIHNGLTRGVNMVRAQTESGAGTRAFSVACFLAKQHTGCPGPCALPALGEHVVAAAVSVGVPERYAHRAVTRGLATGNPAQVSRHPAAHHVRTAKGTG